MTQVFGADLAVPERRPSLYGAQCWQQLAKPAAPAMFTYRDNRKLVTFQSIAARGPTMMRENAPRREINAQASSILVVEDDVSLRYALARWFRLAGYTVYEAATADEAVTLLNSSLAIHVVITDVDMPGTMSGLELARFIESTARGTQVIVVSGHEQTVEGAEVLFFKKPYQVKEIAALISRLLNAAPPEPDCE